MGLRSLTRMQLLLGIFCILTGFYDMFSGQDKPWLHIPLAAVMFWCAWINLTRAWEDREHL